MKDVPSPCNLVCTMDRMTGLCVGCLRTMEEISNWQNYSNEEKQAVLDRIEKRKRESESD